MATKAAANITGLKTQIWLTVNRKKQIVTVGKGTAQKRTVATMCLTLAVKSFDSEQRILFPRAVGTAPEMRGAAVDIALEINKALWANRVPAHIRIQRLAYNEKGNLSGLTGQAATSNMLLPLHRKILLCIARKWDSDMIDVTGH